MTIETFCDPPAVLNVPTRNASPLVTWISPAAKDPPSVVTFNRPNVLDEALLMVPNETSSAPPGVPLLTRFGALVPPMVMLPVEADSAQLVDYLLTSPALRASEASVAAASASVRSSRTDYFPTISTSYGLTNNMSDANFQVWQGRTLQNKSFSLSMSVPIFNGLGREETVQRARITEINARASLRDAQLLARQQLVQYVGQLRLAQARIGIQQASLEAAQEDLRVQQQRYALGASTQLELLTTQSQLNAARFNLVNARYQVRIAKAQIEQLLGREIR